MEPLKNPNPKSNPIVPYLPQCSIRFSSKLINKIGWLTLNLTDILDILIYGPYYIYHRWGPSTGHKYIGCHKYELVFVLNNDIRLTFGCLLIWSTDGSCCSYLQKIRLENNVVQWQ